MTKRDIFAELMEGFDALEDERHGKVTLRTTKVEIKPLPEMTPPKVKALRQELHVSQPVVTSRPRTQPQTIRNWEQGTAKPNAQPVILLSLIDRNPKWLDEIAAL